MILFKLAVTIMVSLVCLFFFAVFLSLSDKAPDTVQATPEPEQPICDVQKAKQVVEALNEAQIFRRISTPAISHDFASQEITVNDDWYLLDIKDKSAFDSWVRCQLSGGLKSKLVSVSYLDPRTGKEVASSSMHSGFSMD